jgi:peptidoglycan lytic transglycosylase
MRLGFLACTAIVASFCLANGPSDARDRNTFTAIAVFYDVDYAGKTAGGQRYDPHKLTAAHRTLPFGTRLLVTDMKTRRSVTVVINDRGPFTKGRTLDLSLAAAKALHMTERGVINVTATIEPRSASGR